MFPINVSHIRHEWIAGGTNNLFRPSLRGTEDDGHRLHYEARVGADRRAVGLDRRVESRRLGTAHASRDSNIAAPQQVWQSKSITLLYSAAEVEGALYYWSTGSAGIMKALVSDRVPEKFYTDPKATEANTCVACHTLSRDGKRLAVNYGGEKLKEVSVPGAGCDRARHRQPDA